MNSPRQPAAVSIRCAAPASAGSTAIERQALEPDPCGFIILTRRWALSARTPSGPASPNRPSPTPVISGWASSGSAWFQA